MSDQITIETFWRPVFKSLVSGDAALAKGWLSGISPLDSFKEAPLSISHDLSTSDLGAAELVLISAPGAVGKSTLARQIAAETGAVLVDLAVADPVGGNTISGGLAKSDLFSSWKAETTALLIDGLDEARLRVTQEAFEAFLMDVADLVAGRNVPTVIFGRTGSIQEAWLALSERNVPISLLEIGFYGRDASVAFACARLKARKPDSPHSSVEQAAIEMLLNRLRAETESDGDRFAGYAPVLQAVADRVGTEENPSALVAQIEKGERPVTLRSVVSQILERERSKLGSLPLDDRTLLKSLYSPQEQLDRLVSRVYGTEQPGFPEMSPTDLELYSNALQNWLPEHPFLDGNTRASSAVFEAIIAVEALRSPVASSIAIETELARGSAANPFLSEFYISGEDSEATTIPPEHLGIIYGSLRARLSLGDAASLQVEGFDESEDENALRAEVEISVQRKDSAKVRAILFETEQVGTIKLGNYIEDVDIVTPYADVELGCGPELLIVSPASIQCSRIFFNSEKVIAEANRFGDGLSIFFEARQYSGPKLTTVPVTRGDVKLSVAWPGASHHPWTAFASEPTIAENPSVDEALRRFRKFVTAFRSHSKGSLARYQHKLEHERMTKGTGQAILDALRADNIITLSNSMYYLNPDKLGELTGATYADVAARKFSAPTISYVKAAIER